MPTPRHQQEDGYEPFAYTIGKQFLQAVRKVGVLRVICL